MNIQLCNTSSENNVIGKTISTIKSVEAVIKGDISYETPTFILQYTGNISTANYVRIPELNRYYFITDIVNLTGGRFEVSCKVDVLESFKTQIKRLSCVIDKQENDRLSNKYYDDGSFVVSSKEFINTHRFNNGFNEDGEFILITAGGGVV